jgi:hypothetical protein
MMMSLWNFVPKWLGGASPFKGPEYYYYGRLLMQGPSTQPRLPRVLFPVTIVTPTGRWQIKGRGSSPRTFLSGPIVRVWFVDLPGGDDPVRPCRMWQIRSKTTQSSLIDPPVSKDPPVQKAPDGRLRFPVVTVGLLHPAMRHATCNMHHAQYLSVWNPGPPRLMIGPDRSWFPSPGSWGRWIPRFFYFIFIFIFFLPFLLSSFFNGGLIHDFWLRRCQKYHNIYSIPLFLSLFPSGLLLVIDI